MKVKLKVIVETEMEGELEEGETIENFVESHFIDGLHVYIKDYDPWFGDEFDYEIIGVDKREHS